MKKLLLKSLLVCTILGMAGLSNGQTVLLSENFSSGSMPAGWSQDSAGITPFFTWTFNNPGGRTITGAGFDTHFVILDSDHYLAAHSENVYLNLPSVNASALATVLLVMDEQYEDYDANDWHQIEISVDGGTSWTHFLTDSTTNVGYPNPAVHSTFDISSIAAGQSNVMIRFHYVGLYGWWWAIDNVVIEDALPPPPANDNCANATSLTVASVCSPTSFTLGSATNSGSPGCGGGVADDDVWFSFVANDTACMLKLTSTGLNHIVEVYDACGGTSIACFNPGTPGVITVIHGLTNGNTYYLEVYTTDTIHDVANCDICLMTLPPTPSNNECVGAVLLTVNSSCIPTSGTLAGATDSGIPGCGGTADDDVWYRFTATDTIAAIQVTGQGQNNPVIEVFDGCGGLSVACMNAAGGSDERGLARTLTIGNTYYFRVFSFGNTFLDLPDFDVCVTSVVMPANDDCANAIQITPVANEDACDLNTFVSTDLATASTDSISCSTTNYRDDVWYFFTATDTTMTISAFNLSGGLTTLGGIGFALYDVCGGNLTNELFCQNPPVPNNRYSFTSLTIGNTYYLRTFTSNSSITGTYNLCLFGGIFTHIREENGSNLQVFPDPTTGILNIFVNNNSAATTIRIFDMIGNLMSEEVMHNISKTTVDLSSFANGIYLVKVENENGLFTQKVILAK